MESWRKVWRDGVAPQLSTHGLNAVRQALVNDDPRLIQGATTSPPPLLCVLDWPVEGADVIGYAGWHGDGLRTVGEVEEYFARVCFKCDETLRDTAVCRFFLNWFDDTPRDEMRRELLDEVNYELAERGLRDACCDICGQRGTEENPIAFRPADGACPDTHYHAAGCPGHEPDEWEKAFKATAVAR